VVAHYPTSTLPVPASSAGAPSGEGSR
jgi:hypothetical protein